MYQTGFLTITQQLFLGLIGGWDEDARGEGKSKGLGPEGYFRIIKGGIDSKDSEGRRQF